jgi:hypothetical protein
MTDCTGGREANTKGQEGREANTKGQEGMPKEGPA